MSQDSVTVLTHSFTPDSLRPINDKLEGLLHQLDKDNDLLTDFIQLVDIRHDLVCEYVNTLSGEGRAQFVEHELKSNQVLLDIANGEYQSVTEVLAKFKRAGRAINHFK